MLVIIIDKCSLCEILLNLKSLNDVHMRNPLKGMMDSE